MPDTPANASQQIDSAAESVAQSTNCRPVTAGAAPVTFPAPASLSVAIG